MFAAPFRPQLAPLLAVCALPFPAPLLAVLAPLLFVRDSPRPNEDPAQTDGALRAQRDGALRAPTTIHHADVRTDGATRTHCASARPNEDPPRATAPW